MARRSRTAYVDKEGTVISRGAWDKLRQDSKYVALAEFQNDRFVVIAEWHGEIMFAGDQPRDQWKPFALEVFVVQRTDLDGRELPEPTLKRDALACDRYRTEEQAIEAAGAFLKRFAGVDDKTLEEMKPLSDDLGSKAEHVTTREEAASTAGCW